MATSNVEEFHPTVEWDHDQTFDTLLVSLPGFKKDHLKIQVTSSRKLRVMGERQNAEKRSQFRTEISIPSNLDIDKVSARFDNGILHVKFSKVIAPAEAHPKPPTVIAAAEPHPKPPKVIAPPEPHPKPPTVIAAAEPHPKPPKVIAPPEPHPKPPTTAPAAPVPTSESPSQKKDQKTDAPPKVEKPDKSKQVKEGSGQKRIEEEKKPKGAEELDEGKKSDDDAQKRAAEKEKKLKENAADISETGPSGNDMKFIEESLARMEQPKNLIISIVAVLLVLMLGHYLKHAFRSFVGRQSDLPNPRD